MELQAQNPFGLKTKNKNTSSIQAHESFSLTCTFDKKASTL